MTGQNPLYDTFGVTPSQLKLLPDTLQGEVWTYLSRATPDATREESLYRRVKQVFALRQQGSQHRAADDVRNEIEEGLQTHRAGVQSPESTAENTLQRSTFIMSSTNEEDLAPLQAIVRNKELARRAYEAGGQSIIADARDVAKGLFCTNGITYNLAMALAFRTNGMYDPSKAGIALAAFYMNLDWPGADLFRAMDAGDEFTEDSDLGGLESCALDEVTAPTKYGNKEQLPVVPVEHLDSGVADLGKVLGQFRLPPVPRKTLVTSTGIIEVLDGYDSEHLPEHAYERAMR